MEECVAVAALRMNHNKGLQGICVGLFMLLVISHRYTGIQCLEMHMWNGGRDGLNVQYVVLGEDIWIRREKIFADWFSVPE